MLVLSRRLGENIVIGDNLVRITVVDIRGDKVRLGITAPLHMSVHREEIFAIIQREQQEQNHGTEAAERTVVDTPTTQGTGQEPESVS